jgi:hypothetical protein
LVFVPETALFEQTKENQMTNRNLRYVVIGSLTILSVTVCVFADSDSSEKPDKIVHGSLMPIIPADKPWNSTGPLFQKHASAGFGYHGDHQYLYVTPGGFACESLIRFDPSDGSWETIRPQYQTSQLSIAGYAPELGMFSLLLLGVLGSRFRRWFNPSINSV